MLRFDLADPRWLWFLALVPVLVVCAWVSRRRRRHDWRSLGQSGRPPGDGSIAWIIAAACLVVALAQPRWGRTGRTLPPGHDVVLALDVSRSMGCQDVVPDRLGRAVELAEGLLQALGSGRGDRVAVVAFAGRGVLRCPLTESLGAVSATLRSLRAGEVRPSGTDLATALEAAAEAFDDQDHDEGRTVVLFSDGEDHPAAWSAALGRLRERDPNVVVHTVAIGDAEHGHPVPLPSRSATPSEPLKYRGQVVLSRRSDTALEAVAKATDGAFLPLGLASADLGRLYRERIGPVAQARRSALRSGEPVERYGLFVLGTLGFCLAACRPCWRRSAVGQGGITLMAIAACVAITGAGAAPVSRTPSPAELVAAGRSAYDRRAFEEALDWFTRARRLAPTSPVPWYDAATALGQLGQYREALGAYQAARERANPRLWPKIDLALGNTAVALGDLEAAIEHYNRCIASRPSGAVNDEARRRALANREFIEAHLRRTAQPPEEKPESSRPSERSKNERGPDERPPASQRRLPQPAGAGAGSGEPPAPNRRGPGGAGGSGKAPPLPGSPEDRLEQALENVREALHHRLEEPLPSEESRDSKDW